MTSMSGRPGGLAMPCATSMRNPSMPRSSQNRSVFSRSSNDLGVVPVQVGLLGVEEVQVPLAGIAVGLDDRVHAGPPKIDTQLFGGWAPAGPAAVAEDVALALVAARAGGQRGLKPGVCAELVWLGTRSIVTLMPSACAASVKPSQRVEPPNSGSTSRGSATS